MSSKKSSQKHYIEIVFRYTAELEDSNITELLEEMRGSGNAEVIGVRAFSSDKDIYELEAEGLL